jgi:FO synthase subunit 2
MCIGTCSFCAFSREDPYFRSDEEMRLRVREAVEYGATEICMQAGLFPNFGFEDYARRLEVIKETAPKIHVHAFSPEEVRHMCHNSKMHPEDALRGLKERGLGSVPGTAAEIFAPRVRKIICPGKLTADDWEGIIAAAHRVGVPTTSTMMYGHAETWEERVEHILRIRDIQRRTGGFTEFVPLPFLDQNSPLADLGYRSPDLDTNLRVHALSRVLLHGHIKNVQASWVKMGPEGARAMLAAGCNDLGGTLMEENISRSAGSPWGVIFHPRQFEALIREAGREPRERTTLYGKVGRAAPLRGAFSPPLRG